MFYVMLKLFEAAAAWKQINSTIQIENVNEKHPTNVCFIRLSSCCCCLVIANIVMIEKKLRSGLYWPTQHNKDDINCVSINTALASNTSTTVFSEREWTAK